MFGGITGDITALGSTIASDLGISHYKNIDINHEGFQGSVYSDTLRDTVSNNIGVFSNAYDLTNNAIDNAGKSALSAATQIPIFNFTGTLGNTARDYVLNGANRDQAISQGAFNVIKDVIKDYILDNIGTDGNNLTDIGMSEEVMKTVIYQMILESLN